MFCPAFRVRFGHLTRIVCYSDTQNTVALCKPCVIFQHINNICINRSPRVLAVLEFQHFKAVALFIASVIFPQLKALFPAYYVLVIRCHYFYLVLLMFCISLAWQMLHFFCVCPLLQFLLCLAVYSVLLFAVPLFVRLFSLCLVYVLVAFLARSRLYVAVLVFLAGIAQRRYAFWVRCFVIVTCLFLCYLFRYFL